MSILADIKKALRQTHDDDDDLLYRQIQSAAYECVKYLNLMLESDQDATDALVQMPPAVINGVILMVQADYDGDPEKRETYLRAAQSLWQPYREDIGA
jgi:hypothetical protein